MQRAKGKGQNLTFIVAFSLLPFAFSCNKELHPIKADTSYYNIYSTSGVDSTIITFISPYRDSLQKEMEVVLATSAVAMEKGKPESRLGNFVADLLLEKGKQYNEGIADFCVVNYGGLRIPSLPAGPITKGMIYELMPFDNFLVIMELNGNVVKQMLDYIASQGGWPVSGIKFKIREEKAFDILINNLPLQPDKNYHVVISDYLADGGDNLSMLKTEKRKNTGTFIRDAILDYLAEQTREGKIISSVIDNRVAAE
jgi:2',3'-cyclic-nucleotide 2'-phosphodiesterase (5'-nucleotidase family)